ncbi:LacI family transcriptional regulator [Opitutaceae bacterium]|nr:LacI family transcriptional regulator [Opitutaceae bacterium]
MAKINQQFIAEELGISRATVSRCFTNHPGINPTTRGKVFALASQLGYNHTEKRGLASHQLRRTSTTLGVLICVDLPSFERTDYGNPGQELLNGLSEVARVQDVRLDLHFVRPEDLHLNSPSYAKVVSAGRRAWDGVVLIYPFPQTIVDELKRKHPVVSLVEQYGQSPLDCVDVDHHRGIERLVEHLAAKGHRRIGFFTWHYPVHAGWALRRYGAYVEMMTARGLEIYPEDAINVDPRRQMPLKDAHAEVIKKTQDGVTAWICAADHQAFDLMKAMDQAGFKVPQDVSITGFDGLEPLGGQPKLTTVGIPFHQIGVIGGKRLLDLIKKRFDSQQHILLNCELISGRTVGKPKAVKSTKRNRT